MTSKVITASILTSGPFQGSKMIVFISLPVSSGLLWTGLFWTDTILDYIICEQWRI